MYMEPILVTGGCGYIGSFVVKELSRRSYPVVVYDNLSTGFANSLLHGEVLVQADLMDLVQLERTFARYKPKSVIHLAGSIVVPDSVIDPLAYYRNNVSNTIHFLECCRNWGVKAILFSSTAAVYGQTESGIVDESSPTSPSSPYGHSKLMDEQIIQDYARSSDLSFMILRYFNVAGADPDALIGQKKKNATHLIKLSCDAALGKKNHLDIFGDDYATPDGTCIRDYIHVVDLAAAHVLALEYLLEKPQSHILNCGYGRGYSVFEVAEVVKRVSQSNFTTKIAERRPGDVSRMVANVDKIKEVLGWKPNLDSLEQIIQSAWDWEVKTSRQEAAMNHVYYPSENTQRM